MISPGKKLDTSFRVKAVVGGEVREVAFAELLKRRTVVSVYMKNNTPSCDRQLADLVAAAPEWKKAGYDVVAVSRDTPGSHRKTAEKKQVPFALVSDPEDAFARATDSLVTKSMYGKQYVGPARAAYVLEADGTVLATIEKVDTAAHAEQVRAVLAGLKKGK